MPKHDLFERPIAHASKTGFGTEDDLQIKNKVSALVFGIKKFHLFLYGQNFRLITDHNLCFQFFQFS